MRYLTKGYMALFAPSSEPKIMSSEDLVEESWRSVGDDLRNAMHNYEQEIKQESAQKKLEQHPSK